MGGRCKRRALTLADHLVDAHILAEALHCGREHDQLARAAVEELLAIMSAPEVECEPAGQWARVPVAREEAEEEPSRLRLSLLGGPTRRGIRRARPLGRRGPL